MSLDIYLHCSYVFYHLVQASAQGKDVDPNVTKYAVKVLPVSSLHLFSLYVSGHAYTCTPM